MAAAAVIIGRSGSGGGGGYGTVSMPRMNQEEMAIEIKKGEIGQKLCVVDVNLNKSLDHWFNTWSFETVINLLDTPEKKLRYDFVKGDILSEAHMSLHKNTVIIRAGHIRDENNLHPFISNFSEIREFKAEYVKTINVDSFDGFKEYMQLTAKKAMLCYTICALKFRDIIVKKLTDLEYEIQFTTGGWPLGTCCKIKAEILGPNDTGFAKISFLWKKSEITNPKPHNPQKMETIDQFKSYIDSQTPTKNNMLEALITLDQHLDIALRTTHI